MTAARKRGGVDGAASEGEVFDGAAGSQRLDRWLWHVRVVKTRSQAAELVTAGNVRVAGCRIEKPSHMVKRGDVVTIVLRAGVRIFEVTGFSERRGDATAAAALYRDLAPPQPRAPAEPKVEAEMREKGSGRPTKRDRRLTDRLKGA